MDKKTTFRIFQSAATAAVAVVLYAAILKPSPVFETLALKTQDVFFQIRHAISAKPDTAGRFVLVSVDNESIARLRERWPLRRSIYADLIARLDAAGASLIALDFVFAGKSTPDDDFLLAETIRKSGKVILASFVDPSGNYIPPLNDLAQAARASGIVNKYVDRDQTVRRLNLLYPDQSRRPVSWPWELRAGAEMLGIDLGRHEEATGRLSFPFTDGAATYSVLRGRGGMTNINYRLAARDITQIPLWQILEGNGWRQQVAGKVVLVGSTSKMIHDEHQTPLGRMPGVVININAIETLVNRDFLPPFPRKMELLAVACVALLSAGAVFFLNIFSALFAMTVITIGWLGVSYFFFIRNTLPDVLAPVFSGWVVFFSVGFYRYLRTMIENLQLRRKAATDPLTGLANRRSLEFRLDEELAKLAQTRSRRKTDFEDELSILMMDIDDFKQINDTLGHIAGDDVIKNVAYAIKANVRAGDIGARYGGEEFCVVLPHTTKLEALRIAEKIRRAVEEKKVSYVNHLTPVTVSVGVAAVHEDGLPAARALVRGADTALYDAKHSGKNRVSIFRPDVNLGSEPGL